MGIRSIIIDFAKKNTFFRITTRAAKNTFSKFVFRFHGSFKRIDTKMIYLNSFGGRSYSDSPKAIYEQMLKDERFNDYHFVWSFKDPEAYDFLKENGRTSVVKSNSIREKRALMKAKYWITNFRMADFAWPKANQIYLQCWHGTVFKKLGYDLKKSENAMNTISEIRNRYRTDAQRFTYLLTSCRYSTEKFASIWNLKETGMEDKIIELGYPRNDILASHTEDDILRIREKLGFSPAESKKIILYAPTWRDNQHSSKLGYVYETQLDFERLRQSLGDEYVILFRAHYLIANSFDFEKYKGFVYDFSDYDDVNDLYLASDLLITDYSSVFFDYAILKRPIIFYMYDIDQYRGKIHEFYFGPQELPGAIVETQDKLVDAIHGIYDFDFSAKYEAFNDKFNYLNDGNSTERVISKIF